MKKYNMDDGFRSDLVVGADFDGLLEIPIIRRPKDIIIPEGITPFSRRNLAVGRNEAIGFNEMDRVFKKVIAEPEKYVDDLSRFMGIISTDNSLYRDMPLATQILNIYRNRAIGYYYQSKGIYVIPQIRWGDERTYTRSILPEKAAFLGVEKRSIVAIGTYGCIQGHENKMYFKNGLYEMLIELDPKVVLVYGNMPGIIFDEFQDYTRFIQYPDWITRRMRGDDYGN